MKPATASSFSAARHRPRVDLVDRGEQQRPALGEELVHHLVLGAEVVVDEPVGDAGLVGDVGDAARVVALAGEDADRASRIWRRRSVDRRCLGHHDAAPPRARRRRRRGGWRATGSVCADPSSSAKSRSATRSPPRRRLARAPPPRVDDHRVAPGLVVRRRLADLAGGDHEDLVLDRAGAQQHLPVVAAGHRGEGGGDGDHAARRAGRGSGRARGSGGRNRRSARARARRPRPR